MGSTSILACAPVSWAGPPAPALSLGRSSSGHLPVIQPTQFRASKYGAHMRESGWPRGLESRSLVSSLTFAPSPNCRSFHLAVSGSAIPVGSPSEETAGAPLRLRLQPPPLPF